MYFSYAMKSFLYKGVFDLQILTPCAKPVNLTLHYA